MSKKIIPLSTFYLTSLFNEAINFIYYPRFWKYSAVVPYDRTTLQPPPR